MLHIVLGVMLASLGVVLITTLSGGGLDGWFPPAALAVAATGLGLLLAVILFGSRQHPPS